MFFLPSSRWRGSVHKINVSGNRVDRIMPFELCVVHLPFCIVDLFPHKGGTNI